MIYLIPANSPALIPAIAPLALAALSAAIKAPGFHVLIASSAIPPNTPKDGATTPPKFLPHFKHVFSTLSAKDFSQVHSGNSSLCISVCNADNFSVNSFSILSFKTIFWISLWH
ncbi:hypothetical protein PFFCH_04687 [Plasmodium falciparum FCH/4]|uniref:Uncharacterized protein n=1 Tax=Plasmodium falciparum FCH/4 TaxID=1036724 RepID=A0A024VJ51_PLAFA|nr:hypothetical protein PFFCH_04687 [Plasmodium falciparum FCH/4]